MRTIIEQCIATSRGGILYDASRVVKPQDALFERGHWAAQGALEEVSGGRGSIALLRSGADAWVLRHYRRGGWAARISRDRYLWSGAARTRSFAEWRLLAELYRAGLPAPAPIAARYIRSGLTYRADLIIELLPGVRTLAQAIRSEPLPRSVWGGVGATVAAFHGKGVHHADLNAHNVLLRHDARAASPVYLIDFDRGRVRPRGAWEQNVLLRLRRSLDKVKRQHPASSFEEDDWRALLAGYEAAPPDQA
jgi:3-deoxy-D-manno-octulosonic acid kinase